MESPRVFRLTRTSLHQLADLSRYAGTLLPSSSPAMQLHRDPDPALETLERSSFFCRPSRSLAKFNPTVRSRDTDGRSEHRSLVSMRAFYAFGARSASISSNMPYRSRSSLSHGNLDISACQARSHVFDTDTFLPRSSTSTSVFDSRRQVATAFSPPPSFSSLSYRTTIPKYSAIRTHISATYRPQPPVEPRGLSTKFSSTVTTPLGYSTKVQKIEYTGVRSSSPTKIRPLNIKLALDFPDQNVPPLIHKPSCASSTAFSQLKEASTEEASKASEQARSPPNLENTPMKREMTAEDIAELSSLRKRNEALEAEVQRLQSLLREKERAEHELKRKLIESEAETKVWRTKCEMQPTIIEIREPAGDTGEISADLINELDSAADKLVRLNAVKDLKMLQGEMETALKEIQER